MIFTDRTITVRKGESRIDEPIVVYRGDYELEVRFTILNSKFRFMSGTNLIESEKASYGQLAILTPYGGNIFSDIVRCNDGSVTFVLTAEMLNQIEEVGLYSFQIRLMDYIKESRVSIPPIEFGIEVREPIASEDHDNSVNNAIVGYSIAKVVDPKEENVGDTFYESGNYNKTKWETGDRISEGKLNKIEDAIDKVNENEINNTATLSRRIDNNFNVLDSTKADKNGVFTMANMGQDIKEAMTGGSVAVTGAYSVDTVNLVANSITKNKTDFIDLNVTNLINIANSKITNINYSTGVKPDYICDDNSIICNVKGENDWLFFFISLDLEIGKTYTCKARKNNLGKDLSLCITYTNDPAGGYKYSFRENEDIFSLTFTCDSEINYLRIHGKNGSIDVRDVILYEGTNEAVWSLDENINIKTVNDGIISYYKLSDDMKDLFYKFDDLLNLNGAEYLTGTNVNSYKQYTDSFDVSFNKGPSYFVFKGQQFFVGHKYVITYNVVGDIDYRFGIRRSRIGMASWMNPPLFESSSQTGGASTTGSIIYNCEDDCCIGFNNSCSLAVSYNATIRIFDVTGYSDEELNKIDFLSLGISNIFVRNTFNSNNIVTSNNLKNKKILVYGDSISQNGYFQNMIKLYFNCNVVTNAIGGTTIGYLGDSSFSSDTRIEQLPSDADYVLIMGGTNDWNRIEIGEIDFSSDTIDKTTLKGGLFYTIKGIQEQCPNAIIVVCTAIGGRGNSTTSTHLYPLLDRFKQSTLDIRNAEIEVANIANVDVCDTWSCGINGFNRTKYISDTVHPNTEGYILLGSYIINYLKKYM